MILQEVLSLLTCLFVGLYAGGMLTEGAILVPYWRKMEPSEFLRLHPTMAPSLFRFFAPLSILATVLSLTKAMLGHVA